MIAKRRTRVVVVVTALSVAWGSAACGHGAPPDRGHPTASRPPAAKVEKRLLPPLPNGPTGPAHADPSPARRVARPARVSVPSVHISSTLEPLRLLANHTLQPPSTWNQAGWYADGARPGEVGPAVIIGHVDSTLGPAVFFRLPQIRPGAEVLIRDTDGTTLRFEVDRVRSYPKSAFPTRAVYGPTALPELRLITCTGDFDYATHNYLDNRVVFAHLVSRR